jgi:hypothetical protein
VTYPPQPPNSGWPDQPPSGGQPPQQPPYPGAPDPHGAQQPPQQYEQYSFGDNTDQGWQSPPQQYEQSPFGQPMGGTPMSGPPMSGPPMSGAPMSGAPMSGQPLSGPPVSGQPTYQQAGPGFPPPPPTKRSPLPFVLGGVALVVVAAIVVGVVVFASRGGKTPQADDSPSPRESASTSASASPTPSAVAGDGVQGDKIVDQATGWGFTMAGSPWKNEVHPTATEIEGAVGQSVALDTNVYATIQLGQLAGSFSYSGPDDLEKTKSDLATAMLKSYYGDGAKVDPSQKHVDEKLTQYGHKAWLWAFEVKYTDNGSSMGEYVVIAVLDAGGGKAGAFWGSVPDGHDDLKNQMVDAASSLKPTS